VLGLAAPLTLFLAGCGSGDDVATKNIAEIATDTPELSTLVEALTATGLVSAVSGKDKITVFAPTNEAFDALGNETLNCLKAPVGLPTLSDVLKYHVVPEEAKAADLTNDESLATLDGKQKLTVSLSDNGTVTIKGLDSATVIQADIMATNGVVHEVDAVLLPENFTKPECGSGTIKATAAGNKNLKTLVTALDAANLTDTFDGSTVYTVFAPTNEAFDKLGDAVACLLKPENKAALTEVLTYHVVQGYDLASDITDGLKVTTLEKEKLTFKIDNTTVLIDTTSGSTANVTIPNVYATNGVVHVIDAVLLPKDFTDNNPCASSTMVDSAIVV
jgi:transforming growth factor-beta-induced protein